MEIGGLEILVCDSDRKEGIDFQLGLSVKQFNRNYYTLVL